MRVPQNDASFGIGTLVWRFRSPHHSRREFAMWTSEPKPHEINKLLVSFDSEVRKWGCRKMMRTSESGHSCGGSEVRIILAVSSQCGLLNQSHTRSISC